MAVPLQEEGLGVGQGVPPHPRAESAELAKREGEAGNVANDRHGLARMGASDLLEGGGHAVEDVLACLAVGDSLLQVLLDDPSAEHFGGPSADGRVGRAFVLSDADLGQLRRRAAARSAGRSAVLE